MTTKNISQKENIFVDTAQTCNLLCKIIIDYIPNKYCNIENITNNSAQEEVAEADVAGADVAEADVAEADVAEADVAGADVAGADVAGA